MYFSKMFCEQVQMVSLGSEIAVNCRLRTALISVIRPARAFVSMDFTIIQAWLLYLFCFFALKVDCILIKK